MTEAWLGGDELGSPAPRRAPLHDKLTWIAFTQLAAWAWFMYGFGAAQALLRDEQGTTRAVSALHGSALALVGLAGAFLAAPLVRRWGRGVLLRIATIGMILAILLYTAPGASTVVTIIGAGLVGFFGTFVVVAINAFILDHQGSRGPAALTEANALASLAGLLGPLAIGLGAATVFGWRWGMWIAVTALVIVEIARGRDLASYGTRSLAEREAHRGRFGAPVFWSLGVVVCFIGTEFCLTLWGADLLRERCDFGPAAAAASLGAVTGGMLVGRFGGARLAERYPSELMLRVSVVLALASFALAWAFTLWPIVLTGLFLTGVSIGIHWPLGMARVVRASGGRTDQASAAASVAAGIAIASMPFALGAMSDLIGFHTAFLIVPALLTAALVMLVARPVPDAVPDVVAIPHG